jgi:pheromone shutdown protein TraB
MAFLIYPGAESDGELRGAIVRILAFSVFILIAFAYLRYPRAKSAPRDILLVPVFFLSAYASIGVILNRSQESSLALVCAAIAFLFSLIVLNEIGIDKPRSEQK